jgi:hypothetical protein
MKTKESLFALFLKENKDCVRIGAFIGAAELAFLCA